ncbi:DUF1266 domain-containing protein [Paenibacillus filicis]|uniref:DUF1266 domain-containing protein n=1 Tax=Paenibacillus filicis TaxID=669464 RepID=A0ABU9DN76_9BACL
MPDIVLEERKKLDLYASALSAVCFSGDSMYEVAMENKQIRRSYYRQGLDSWTSEPIKNAQSLKQVLDWIDYLGRRHRFNDWTRKLSTMSEAGRERYIQSLDGHVHKVELLIVNRYLRRLPAGGIAAVDYAWSSFLCQAGLEFNYLTRDEYYAYLLQTARNAQRDYGGWNEYVIGFAAGIQFVDRNMSTAYMEKEKSAITELLTSRHSPFEKVSWSLELG